MPSQGRYGVVTAVCGCSKQMTVQSGSDTQRSPLSRYHLGYASLSTGSKDRASIFRESPGSFHTSAQRATVRLISSGGLLLEPLGVSFVRGPCAPVPLVGQALGGSIGVEIGAVNVSVTTLAGQPLAAILKALALAIRSHPTLESLGISATVSGFTLQVRGGGTGVNPFSDDPGLLLGNDTPPSLPALPPAGLGALAALLAAAGVFARRLPDRSGGR